MAAAARSNVPNIATSSSTKTVPPSTPTDSAGSSSANIICSGFEGQVFRKNRCKRCFRDKIDHVPPTNLATPPKPAEKPPLPAVATKVTPILKKPANGTVTPDKPPMASPYSTGKPKPAVVKNDADSPSSAQNHLNTTTQTIVLSKTSSQTRRSSSTEGGSGGKSPGRVRPVRRCSSAEKVSEEDADGDGLEMRTPLSGSLMSMVTAVESASDLQSMHTAISGGSISSLNSAGTFTSSREHFQDTIEEMQARIDALTEQLEEKDNSLKDLEQTNLDLREQLSSPLKSGTNAPGGTLTRKRDETVALQKKIKDLERENAEFSSKNKAFQNDLDLIRECMDEVNDPDEANQPLTDRIRDCAHKLQSAEMMCEDLMDDNEELKKELRSLEAEMDELHDNFRQDQAMEFQTIQKELEQTMKNCRILQFKLRKSERKCDELEADKAVYEVKVRQMTSVTQQQQMVGPENYNVADNMHFREMENELRQIMDVNKRLQEEIEHIEEERTKLKLSYDILTKNSLDADKQRETYRIQNEKHAQTSAASNSSSGQEYDVNQLLRDLCDSVERETDLRDQLKFSEDEAKRLRKQLVDMEQENDNLQHQLKKMSAARPPSGDFSKATEAFDAMRLNDELKVQLDVSEHEISSLKRRLNEAEQTNENLSLDIKKLKGSYDELRAAKDRMSEILEDTHDTGGPGKPKSYYEQKIKLLEAETNDLRKKLVDKERQLERLSAEIEVAKRKGTMNRSKSLDDGQIVDLKRQLQMTEQEITVLRQKTQALEAEQDRMASENKRLQFKSGGKRGSTEKSVDETADFEKHLPDIAVLASTGKSAKELVDDVTSLTMRTEELERVISAARVHYEKILEKTPLRKDVASRQELKARIEELESDMKNALTIAEQEGTAARRLQSEVEDLRSKVRRKESDMPVTDEFKEYRMKLYVAEQEMETLRHELREVQASLTEERRRARSSESELVTKERMDTEVRNLKQELGKQRYIVDELTAKDNALSKQVNDWQKKYHSLKDAYKSDTDAWQKELTDFEQELTKEKNCRSTEVASKDSVLRAMDKEVQMLKNKLGSYEEQIRNLIEAGKIREKEAKDRIARLEIEMTKDKKSLDELRGRFENQDMETAMQEAKIKVEKERLEQKITSLTRELEESSAAYKRDSEKLRTESEALKKTRFELEKSLQETKNELDKMKREYGEQSKTGTAAYGAKGLSAYERAKAADQIKEEVEKLHKQNFELQKQLLDAKRASDDASQQLQSNERKWTCEKDEVNRKLRQDEKIHKAEISAVTMRFENKQKLLEDETKTLTSNVKQLKKERETLQERLDGTLAELQKLRDEHRDCASRIDSANNALIVLKSSRDSYDKQMEELQAKLAKFETDRNEAKTKAAKEKSSYELRISELQNKLGQYEGQHAKLSAYALKTRQMGQAASAKKVNGDAPEVSSQELREKIDSTEKALKKLEKDAAEARTQISAMKVDKEREGDLLRAKIRELQDKHKPVLDAHHTLQLNYDSMRTEYEVIRIERDDLAERLTENESSQIKERGKIDQILTEIQRLKEVAPLFSSDEDLHGPPLPTVPSRPSRGRSRDPAGSEEKSPSLPIPSQLKYKGKKSADLQKAIDNITKVSEDIKAERKTRRPILPHKRSQSASIAESTIVGSSPLIRRYPSVDAQDSDESCDVVTLPKPTPLKAIPKYPTRNPRFPSIPPSFLVTPPSAARGPNRSRSYETQPGHRPITEESFTNPGGSWDSIDSDVSTESWNYPMMRDHTDDHFTSLPNLPQKVDSATSTEDKPRKKTLLETAQAKRKKLMAKLRPLSLHSSKESLEETVTTSSSSGFYDKLSQPSAMTQTSRTPSPSASKSSDTTSLVSKSSTISKPNTPLAAPVNPERSLSPAKPSTSAPTSASATPYNRTRQAIPAPRVAEETNVKAMGAAMTMRTSITILPQSSSSPAVGTVKDQPVTSAPAEKEVKFTEGKSAGKPYINAWRKPISDIAKKFETKK